MLTTNVEYIHHTAKVSILILCCAAFVDDCYLCAQSPKDAQEMLNDVVNGFQQMQAHRKIYPWLNNIMVMLKNPAWF